MNRNVKQYQIEMFSPHILCIWQYSCGYKQKKVIQVFPQRPQATGMLTCNKRVRNIFKIGLPILTTWGKWNFKLVNCIFCWNFPQHKATDPFLTFSTYGQLHEICVNHFCESFNRALTAAHFCKKSLTVLNNWTGLLENKGNSSFYTSQAHQ